MSALDPEETVVHQSHRFFEACTQLANAGAVVALTYAPTSEDRRESTTLELARNLFQSELDSLQEHD